MGIEKKLIILLAALSTLSILIWFGGPYLSFGNQFPLHSAEKRFYIILLLFLTWVLTYILTVPDENPTLLEGNSLKKLRFLQGRFAGAIYFLKKNVIPKKGSTISLSELPWYLFLGPGGSGKTSLLVNSHVNFILTKQFKQERMSPSRTCDWWVTKDYVIVDVPGNYFSKKEGFLWAHLINLIKKYHHQDKIKGIVIAIPLPELNKLKNPQEKKQIVLDIKQKIVHLKEEYDKNIPFYFVITKCDQIAGFTDFFGESSIEELNQAWGVILPPVKENETLLDPLVERFNALIKRLNEQLIPRLHQERNVNARSAIKDFPLHVERLKESLCNFIHALALPSLNIQGIFLTSAKQNLAEETNHLHVINSNSNQALQLHRAPLSASKAYFIKHFILQGLLCSSELESNTVDSTAKWQRMLTYAGAVFIILLAAIFLARDFQQGLTQIYAIQSNVAQYHFALQNSDNQDPLIKSLPLLNALKIASNNRSYQLPRFKRILSFYSDKSLKTTSEIYRQTLQRIVLPEIKNHFENYLKQDDPTKYVQTYAVLQAYLMLGDTNSLDDKSLTAILSQILPERLNNQRYQDLLTHIQSAFNDYHLNIEIDSALVNMIRKRFANLSTAELAFVILKNKNNYGLVSSIDLNIANSSSSFSMRNADTTRIANLFTAESFSKVISEDLPIAAKEALTGNSVMGYYPMKANDPSVSNLIGELRNKYINSYVAVWENLLNNLTLSNPTNLAQTDSIITMLMSKSSPLLLVLQTIKENTSFAPIMGTSIKIKALNNLLASAQSNEDNNLYQVFVSLRQLHAYLQTILNSNDVGEAAFTAAKDRLQHTGPDRITQIHFLAEQTPEPMSSWLHTLATSSWTFILKETGHYIENNWQTNIMSIYHSQLADRFPINPTATQEVDLMQLTTFAGKQGILEQFFQNFLKPFVNYDNKQWQCRVIDNQKLPISNLVLAQMQYAARLQKYSKYSLFTQGHKNISQFKFQLPAKLIEES